MNRIALPLALLLGAAVAVAAWVRIGAGSEVSVEVTVREVARTGDRVVSLVEITTDLLPEVLTIHPSSEWVRWDPEETGVADGRRRILGKATVGLAGAGREPGLWLRVGGRPVRWIDLRP